MLKILQGLMAIHKCYKGGAKKATPKQDKKTPVPAGYKLYKNGVPYKKENTYPQR